MKELTAKGRAVVKRKDTITLEDEAKLWSTGTINKSSAKGISYGVFFYNCKVFGFRGMSEHRNALAEQYKIMTDGNGKTLLTYQEHFSKTLQGGLQQRKVEPKNISQFSEPDNPRDVVGLFSTYLNIIPTTGPFYRRPILFYTGEPRFSAQVVGVNTLGKYMATMFQDAKIDLNGRNITNHSGRVFCCTTLYNQGFSDNEITARSGHRSNAVQQYKRPSEELLKSVSNALQPPCVKKQNDDKETIPYTATSLASSSTDNDVLRINVPSCINHIIISKDGKEKKISL